MKKALFERPLFVNAYLVIFMGMFSMIISLIFTFLTSEVGVASSLLLLGVLGNTAGTGLLYADKRLNDLEEKLEALTSAKEPDQSE